MLRAAVTLASFGMLRSAEYTSPHKCFWDPQGNLNVVDVTTVSPSQIKVRIKCSKSEQFHNGVRIQCPLILICAQFQCYSVFWYTGRWSGTVVCLFVGGYLTRQNMVSLLRKALPYQANLNTHSFRKSNAFLSYVRLPRAATDSAYLALARPL